MAGFEDFDLDEKGKKNIWKNLDFLCVEMEGAETDESVPPIFTLPL